MSERRPESGAEVLELRRPPVRRSAVVHADQERTFAVFVREIGTWWPLVPTQVELAFAALAPSLTRVSVAHRGWERILGRLVAHLEPEASS